MVSQSENQTPKEESKEREASRWEKKGRGVLVLDVVSVYAFSSAPDQLKRGA